MAVPNKWTCCILLIKYSDLCFNDDLYFRFRTFWTIKGSPLPPNKNCEAMGYTVCFVSFNNVSTLKNYSKKCISTFLCFVFIYCSYFIT
ncbi:hypothetical protein FKM82_031240 [Ascaphus truei]